MWFKLLFLFLLCTYYFIDGNEGNDGNENSIMTSAINKARFRHSVPTEYVVLQFVQREYLILHLHLHLLFIVVVISMHR